MFKRGDFLLDQNRQYSAYVIAVGQTAYFLRVTNLENDEWFEQMIDKGIVNKRFYLRLDQEMGKLLYLHSPIHVCGGVEGTGVKST